MATDYTDPPQRRCPVCWQYFTIHPKTPYRRYCCGACRVEDWRRRHDRAHQLAEYEAKREHEAVVLEPTLDTIRDRNRAFAEEREARQAQRALNERRSTTNPTDPLP